jgi:CheY-like chemotaxis protein
MEEGVMTGAPPLNLLLVEDDDVAAEAVVRGLHKHAMSCPVISAEDGNVALQILRGNHTARQIAKPYLVLLDLNMPLMNGFEFLGALRADPELRDTVVFVLTTSNAETDRARAYQKNIAGYIVKSAIGPQFSGLARFLTEYRRAVQLPS